jgi:hypothetical protein
MSKAQLATNFRSNARRSGKTCLRLLGKGYLHWAMQKRTAQMAIVPLFQARASPSVLLLVAPQKMALRQTNAFVSRHRQ